MGSTDAPTAVGHMPGPAQETDAGRTRTRQEAGTYLVGAESIESMSAWMLERLTRYSDARGEKAGAFAIYYPLFDEVTQLLRPEQLLLDAPPPVRDWLGSRENLNELLIEVSNSEGSFRVAAPNDGGRRPDVIVVLLSAEQVALIAPLFDNSVIISGNLLQAIHMSQPHEYEAYRDGIQFSASHDLQAGLRHVVETILGHWDELPSQVLDVYNALLPTWQGDLTDLLFHSHTIAGVLPVGAGVSGVAV